METSLNFTAYTGLRAKVSLMDESHDARPKTRFEIVS